MSEKTMKKTKRLVVDSCPDANGFFTIRENDGSEEGNTSIEPIATVYDQDMAERLVYAYNAMIGSV